MNTPCKILAMAWMVLRPLCPNVHADNDIHWREISHFFNFDTIVEEEKQANLKTNVRLLVEEQLKLPSGKNLWKAFQFWEKQHPELGFKFEFTLSPGIGAEVVLKDLKNSFEGKQIFCFEILINKLFTEKLEADQILNENMLYRPCLIKLTDINDSNEFKYYLREQELPFFITLAHEFLHALNQLERIDQYWIFDLISEYNKTGNLLSTLDGQISMQKFLADKLSLKDDIGILSDKYLNFWGNENNDDFLDEMTVILQSRWQIAENTFVFIGETTFLQEYYGDRSIISWSHYSANSIKFWEKMSIILKKGYVNNVFNYFNFSALNLFEICNNSRNENCVFKTYKTKRSDKKKTEIKVQTYLNSQIPTKEIHTIVGIINIEHVGSKLFIKKHIFNDTRVIKLLPRCLIFNN